MNLELLEIWAVIILLLIKNDYSIALNKYFLAIVYQIRRPFLDLFTSLKYKLEKRCAFGYVFDFPILIKSSTSSFGTIFNLEGFLNGVSNGCSLFYKSDNILCSLLFNSIWVASFESSCIVYKGTFIFSR